MKQHDCANDTLENPTNCDSITVIRTPFYSTQCRCWNTLATQRHNAYQTRTIYCTSLEIFCVHHHCHLLSSSLFTAISKIEIINVTLLLS